MANTAFTCPTPVTSSSNALFQAWATAISNAFAAMSATGLVRVGYGSGVTGGTQGVNDVLPAAWIAGSGATAGGYEVYKLADPAGGSGASPVFFKLEYWPQTGNAGLRITIGTTYAGTGPTLGGCTGGPYQLMNEGGYANTTGTCWLASDGDGFVFAMNFGVTTSAQRFLMALDRQRNLTGAAARYSSSDPSPMGFAFYGQHSASTRHAYVFDPAANEVGDITALIISRGTIIATQSLTNGAGEVNMMHGLIATRQQTYLTKMILAVPAWDCPIANVTLVPTWMGAARTYKTIGNNASTGFTGLDYYNQFTTAAMWWTD